MGPGIVTPATPKTPTYASERDRERDDASVYSNCHSHSKHNGSVSGAGTPHTPHTPASAMLTWRDAKTPFSYGLNAGSGLGSVGTGRKKDRTDRSDQNDRADDVEGSVSGSMSGLRSLTHSNVRDNSHTTDGKDVS